MQQYQKNPVSPLDAERSKYAEAVERLRATVLDEANVIKAVCVSKRGSVIRAKSPQNSKKNSEFIADKALNENVLYGQFIIRLETGRVLKITPECPYSLGIIGLADFQSH